MVVDSGFALSVATGAQVPLSLAVTTSLPDVLAAAGGVEEAADRIGEWALPTLDILRIGFGF